MLVALIVKRLAAHRLHVLVIVFLQLLQAAASLMLPTLNARIIDDGLVRGETVVILQLGWLMMVLAVIQAAAAVLAACFSAVAAMRFGTGLRQEVFDKIQQLSKRDVGRFGPASLVVRTTNDIQQVQNLTLLVFTMLVAAPVMGLGGVVMALQQDVALSGIVLVVIPLLTAIMVFIVRRLVPLHREGQALLDRINNVLREQVMGAGVIRAFVRQPLEMRRFGAANDALTRNNLRSALLVAAMLPLVMIVVNLSSTGVVWLGGQRILSGEMRLGALTAFIAYIMQILVAIMMAMYVLMSAPRASVSAERIQAVLDAVGEGDAGREQVRPSPQVRPSRPARGLEFRNVAFAYPGAEDAVVEQISFLAPRGSVTALIGATGSGKSTIVNLVPRLLEATAGEILLDGVSTAGTPLGELRRRIAVVPQQSWLFTGSIADNLRIAEPGAAAAQLWHALETAQAAGFVRDLPRGLETVVGHGGVGLSGGQRQRLCIARALLRSVPVYVFDDSFSALDSVTEADLRASLEPEVHDSAVLLVAQRASTAASADQILVVDDGRLVGVGTHSDLLASCRTYQEIVASQQALEAV